MARRGGDWRFPTTLPARTASMVSELVADKLAEAGDDPGGGFTHWKLDLRPQARIKSGIRQSSDSRSLTEADDDLGDEIGGSRSTGRSHGGVGIVFQMRSDSQELAGVDGISPKDRSNDLSLQVLDKIVRDFEERIDCRFKAFEEKLDMKYDVLIELIETLYPASSTEDEGDLSPWRRSPLRSGQRIRSGSQWKSSPWDPGDGRDVFKSRGLERQRRNSSMRGSSIDDHVATHHYFNPADKRAGSFCNARADQIQRAKSRQQGLVSRYNFAKNPTSHHFSNCQVFAESSEKRHFHWDVEDEHDEEEDIAQATQELLKCIKDQRTAAKSVATQEREIVLYLCKVEEQWLWDKILQPKTLPSNVRWSYEIRIRARVLDSMCRRILKGEMTNKENTIYSLTDSESEDEDVSLDDGVDIAAWQVALDPKQGDTRVRDKTIDGSMTVFESEGEAEEVVLDAMGMHKYVDHAVKQLTLDPEQVDPIGANNLLSGIMLDETSMSTENIEVSPFAGACETGGMDPSAGINKFGLGLPSIQSVSEGRMHLYHAPVYTSMNGEPELELYGSVHDSILDVAGHNKANILNILITEFENPFTYKDKGTATSLHALLEAAIGQVISTVGITETFEVDVSKYYLLASDVDIHPRHLKQKKNLEDTCEKELVHLCPVPVHMNMNGLVKEGQNGSDRSDPGIVLGVIIYLLNHEASSRTRVVGGDTKFSNSSDSSIEERSMSSLDLNEGILGELSFSSFPDHYQYVLHLILVDKEGTPYQLMLLHMPRFNRNGACQDEGNTSLEQLLIDVGADILFANLVAMSVLTQIDSTCFSIANRVVMTLREQYRETKNEGMTIGMWARNLSPLSCVISDLDGNLKACSFPAQEYDTWSALASALRICGTSKEECINPSELSMVKQVVRVFDPGGYEDRVSRNAQTSDQLASRVKKKGGTSSVSTLLSGLLFILCQLPSIRKTSIQLAEDVSSIKSALALKGSDPSAEGKEHVKEKELAKASKADVDNWKLKSDDRVHDFSQGRIKKKKFKK